MLFRRAGLLDGDAELFGRSQDRLRNRLVLASAEPDCGPRDDRGNERCTDQDERQRRRRQRMRRFERRRRLRVFRAEDRTDRDDEVAETDVTRHAAERDRLRLERADDVVLPRVRHHLERRRRIERHRPRKIDRDQIADGRLRRLKRRGDHRRRAIRSRKKRSRSRSYGTAVESCR